MKSCLTFQFYIKTCFVLSFKKDFKITHYLVDENAKNRKERDF